MRNKFLNKHRGAAEVFMREIYFYKHEAEGFILFIPTSINTEHSNLYPLKCFGFTVVCSCVLSSYVTYSDNNKTPVRLLVATRDHVKKST